jgi:capsular exopolysaccharide synthesis family protein
MGNIKPTLLLPDPGNRGPDVTTRRPLPDRKVPGAPDLQSGSGFSDEIEKGSLLDYWRLLSRRRYLLISLTIAGALGGVLVSLSQSPVYQAHASVEVQDLNQDFLNMKQVSQVEDSSPANALTDLQTQLQILQSETLIEQTLDKLDISSTSALDPKTSWLAKWHSPATPPPHSTSGRNQLIEAAAKKLKVTVTGQTRIIDVSFQSTDPAIASGFVNSIMSGFISQNLRVRGQLIQRTSSWLGQQLNSLRANLRRSDEALQAYARQSGLIYTGDKENVSTEKLRQLQAQLSQAQGDLALKEARFRIASTASPDTLTDVLNDSSLRALRNRITELRSQEAQLATTFKPEYSKAKQTRAEIETMEAALQHERSEIVTRITNDYVEAEHRQGLLSDFYNNQVKLVMQDSQNSIQYDILKREVDTNRQTYESMLQRVKDSGITAALSTSNIRVVDPARTPEKPIRPILPLNAFAGLLSGLILGMVVAVTSERADRKLHQPGDAGRLLGIPELGVIPRADRFGKDAGIATVSVLQGEDRGNAQIAAWQVMPTGFADSFRAVLVSILFAQGEESRSVLVISSAGPNEGKTTAATNLAVALAKIGQSVLLIDGDIRKPSVHKVFGLYNNIGVTNLLNQVIFDGPAADAATQETDFPDLRVLTSGPPLQTGCDLLFTTSMPRLIAYYKDRFDRIIIDSPPLLHMPDARMLGRMADAVVLVARAGHTLREAALAARERLMQDQTPVLGVILNDWDPKFSPDGYYGNYKDAVLKKYNVS